MNIESIIEQLEEERDRLNAAIDALRGSGRSSSVRHTSTSADASGLSRRQVTKKNLITPAGRKRLSEMMKKRWRERRKKEAKTK